LRDHPLALDFLTVPELSPPDLIHAAAENGCCSVSLLVQPLPYLGDYGLIGDTPSRRATRRASEAEGVAVDTCEAFVLAPETNIEGFRPALESAAYLGARFVNALVRDPDEARMLDNLARFSDLAVEFTLRPLIEFMAMSSLSSLASAVRAIEKTGSKALALEVDALHLQRTGGSPTDLPAIAPHLIARAQINDGPLVSSLEARVEATQQRQIPGTGEFPLVDFVRALPDGIIIGIEVPLRDLAERGIGPAHRVRRAAEGAKGVLARAD
jgi:sugar phosphate isomerase/epimerase